ncbi:transcriptional repressor [Galbibacter sp. PAP.153]|uniref:Fur family transcriptional regulator n=1 Tax=Galbibacter sp. PAP.153 TaxID=3104623 RepID=UPI00300B694B
MNKAEKILINKGIRPTEMRLAIYKYLNRKFYAVTLKEIEMAFIKKSDYNKTVDRTTIYRTLKLFQDEGIAHQIDDGTAIAKYAVSNEEGLDLHLHFHCTHCGNTFCLPDKVNPDSLPDKYVINDVNLVLKSICTKCLKKENNKKPKK